MSVSFTQLLELLQSQPCSVEKIRYCTMTPDIVHLVLQIVEPSNGFGEAFLTADQFAQIRAQFPSLRLVETGTFPLPPR